MITNDDLKMMEMRIEAGKRVKTPKVGIVDAFEGLEGELQDMIKDECKKRGFYFVHSRRDKRTTTAIGTPDFIIACHKGISLWVECKAGKSKPSIEQMAVGIMLEHLNQNYKLVYNLKTFLDFVEEKCGQYICQKCGLRRDGQHEVRGPKF